MLRTDKEQIVSILAEQLAAAETLIVADYRGLTNKQLESLRDELLRHGARFRIVKNTLTRRAAEAAGAESLLMMLEGPTAIAFIEADGDPAAVAKAIATTAKETNVLTMRGGVLAGKTLSGEQVSELATLPPVDILRGQLVGAVVAPLTQLVALLAAPLRDLHGLVDARIAQLREAEPEAAAAPEAPEAEAEPEPTPEDQEEEQAEQAEEDEPTAEAESEPVAEAQAETPMSEEEASTESEES